MIFGDFSVPEITKNHENSLPGNQVKKRLKNLKAFSNTYELFTTQLDFIAFELNGTQRSANIRLLDTERYNGDKGSLKVFAKYYLKMDFPSLEKLSAIGDYE